MSAFVLAGFGLGFGGTFFFCASAPVMHAAVKSTAVVNASADAPIFLNSIKSEYSFRGSYCRSKRNPAELVPKRNSPHGWDSEYITVSCSLTRWFVERNSSGLMRVNLKT